jgi:hypothetical protein
MILSSNEGNKYTTHIKHLFLNCFYFISGSEFTYLFDKSRMHRAILVKNLGLSIG